MDYYPESVLPRAMKVQEVIYASDILGISPIRMRRWRARYEKYGYDGLYDRRKRIPSPKGVPLDIVRMVLELYRERYSWF